MLSRRFILIEIQYIRDRDVLMSDKFTIHSQKRISELRQRMRNSKLHSTRKN